MMDSNVERRKTDSRVGEALGLKLGSLTLPEFESLRMALKKMTLKECNVEGVTAAEVSNDEPVIGGTGSLRLDSLDAVEIVTSLERCLGLKFESAGASRPVFKSFTVMTEYVAQNAGRDRVLGFISQ